MISFIHCASETLTDTGFLATSQLMLEEVSSYIWAHSNSLIKNVTPFEYDAENRLLDFLICSLCKQPEGAFIKMASLKIDFSFDVFKQLQNHILSYLTGATLEFTETNSYFYSLTSEKKKTYLAVHHTGKTRRYTSGQICCEFVCRQKSCGFNTKIFSI